MHPASEPHLREPCRRSESIELLGASRSQVSATGRVPLHGSAGPRSAEHHVADDDLARLERTQQVALTHSPASASAPRAGAGQRPASQAGRPVDGIGSAAMTTVPTKMAGTAGSTDMAT